MTMIIVRLTDCKTFARPFSADSPASLLHGCQTVFQHLTTEHGEKHLRSLDKFNATLQQVEDWLAVQLAEFGRSKLDIASIYFKAKAWREKARRGIFFGKRDPDFFILPEALQLHIYDRHSGIPVDPSGRNGYWLVSGDFAPKGETYQQERCGTNITVWRDTCPVVRLYQDNHISLSAQLTEWERIWQKCLSADAHMSIWSSHGKF